MVDKYRDALCERFLRAGVNGLQCLDAQIVLWVEFKPEYYLCVVQSTTDKLHWVLHAPGSRIGAGGQESLCTNINFRDVFYEGRSRPMSTHELVLPQACDIQTKAPAIMKRVFEFTSCCPVDVFRDVQAAINAHVEKDGTGIDLLMERVVQMDRPPIVQKVVTVSYQIDQPI